MSHENIENLRAFLDSWSRALEALQRGEVIDMPMQLLDPAVAFEDTVLPDQVGETYRGHEGVARAMDRWLEPFEWLLVELEQIVGAGDRLVSIHRARAKARHTGIEFEMPVAYVWTFRDGSVVHFRSYSDVEQAVAAADLQA